MMATGDDQWLKEDGYLNVDTDSVRIVYHPFLNVILVFARSGEVKVLDVNSGVILQSYRISDDLQAQCRYLPDQDKILFWNGRNVSMRGDYNGVLLLDTILQAPITQADDNIRIELLLSEAVLFLQCLQNLEQHGLENTADVTNELTLKINEAQQHAKRGDKSTKVGNHLSGITTLFAAHGCRRNGDAVKTARSTYSCTSNRVGHQ